MKAAPPIKHCALELRSVPKSCQITVGVPVRDQVWDTWTKTGHVWRTNVCGGLTLAGG